MNRTKLIELLEIDIELPMDSVKEHLKDLGIRPAMLWEEKPEIPMELSPSTAKHWRMAFRLVDLLGSESQRDLVRKISILSERFVKVLPFEHALQLISDIHHLCEGMEGDYVLTEELLELLHTVDHDIWKTYRGQAKGFISAKSIAGLLSFFEIEPVRVPAYNGKKGYRLADIRDAYERLDDFKAQREEMIERQKFGKKPPAPKVGTTESLKKLKALNLSSRIKKG